MGREKKKTLSHQGSTNEMDLFERSLHPDVRELYGSLELDREMSWKEELTRILWEKYQRSSPSGSENSLPEQ